MKYIALLGEFTRTFKPHIATDLALRHSGNALGTAITGEWVSTQDIDDSLFSRYSGIWVAPGSPYKNLERTLWALEHARTNKVPCFGTCGGFQHMVLEYARNVLQYRDAQHAEYDPYASTLFISGLACSLAGREMELKFENGSIVADIYDQPRPQRNIIATSVWTRAKSDSWRAAGYELVVRTARVKFG